MCSSYTIISEPRYKTLDEKKFEVEVGHQDQVLNWEEYGFKLFIPKNALEQSSIPCTLQIQCSIAGPYYFPKGYELVSAVYWIYASPECKFIKPVTIEIEHSASTAESELTFVRADVSYYQNLMGYNFEKSVNVGKFSKESNFGTLNVSGFSGLAAASNSSARFYSGRLFYLCQSIEYWFIHMTITLDTKAHIKVSCSSYYKYL